LTGPSVKKKNQQLERKTVNKAKDELEFASNWRRVFIDIYQHLKWLNSFSQINLLAI